MFKKILVPILLLVLLLGPSYSFGETNSSETTSSQNESKAPRGDLSNWQQVFVDDFDEYGNLPVGSFSDCNHNANDFKQAYCGGLKEPLRSRWWAYPKGWPDTARQRKYTVSGQYNPDETVSIEDGKLKVVMKSDGKENQVAALVPKATVGQTYGRYAIRFKTDSTPGYKIAWLLWPDNEKTCDKCEIDFPETELDRTIVGYMHHKSGQPESEDDKKNSKVIQDYYVTDQKPSEWHTAVIEWSPGKVEFFLDGKKLQGKNPQGETISASTQNVPDQPMTWVIQSESALDDRARNEEVVAKENSTATILIDWVAAYTYKGKEDNQEQPTNPDEQENQQDQETETENKKEVQEQEQKPKEKQEDSQEEKLETENRQEREQDQKSEEEKQERDQEEPTGTEDKQQEVQEKDSEEKNNQEEKQKEEPKSDEQEPKDNQVKPKIKVYPVLQNNEELKVSINLENAKNPKGTWLVSFDNEEPKRYENKGASIEETFKINDQSKEEVPLTVEFEGKDADGQRIQVKITEQIKVKQSTDEQEDKTVLTSGREVGGKLPKTDTDYQQGIGLGLIISLLGVIMFSVFDIRRKNI